MVRIDGGGSTAAGLGDVNGDGVGDLGVGPVDGPTGRRGCRAVAQTVFGRPAFGRFDLDAIGDGGLRLRCPDAPELEDRGPPGSGVSYGIPSGGTIAGAGDFDGDGIGDFAVGSLSAGPRRRPAAGQVHVVFGGGPPGMLDARGPGDRVVRIDGPERAAQLGEDIVALGDVDGDGFDDLALPHVTGVAAPDGRRMARDERRVAVVFGGPRGGPIDLAAGGDRVTLFRAGARTGSLPFGGAMLAAAPGDVDGDGRPDLALGLPYAARGAGRVLAFRIPGRGTAVDVREAEPVLRIDGRPADHLGSAMAPAGDMDGDGRADLALGASLPSNAVATFFPRGAVHFVPSRAGTTIDLADRPDGVRTIVGPKPGLTHFATSITPLGNVTGDSRDDVLVGAPGASPDCRHEAGAAYVVPGGPAGTIPVTRAPGAWRLDGASIGVKLGDSVAAGDVTGDGRPDLLLTDLGYDSSAAIDLRLLPAVPPTTTAPPLPGQEECLRARLAPRSLRALRAGRAVVRLRSNLGTGRRHSVVVRMTVVPVRERPRTVRDYTRIERLLHRSPSGRTRVRFSGPGRRRLVVRLGPKHRRALATARMAYVDLEALQLPGGHALGWSFVVAR